MVASTPQPPSGGMVGKKELLQWASQASGRIVTKFDELKDGDVLLRCMKETWPAAYDRCRRKGQPRSVSGNFELMGNMFEHLELPKSVLDTRGIQHASFKSCYNFLVMAFFLKNLATHSDFSVDFTHPVDSKLAAFLQAPESVASLHKGGALAPPGGGSAPSKTSRGGASSSARSSRDAPRERSSPARRDRDDALESASAAALRAEAALANEEANRRALLAATSTSPRRRRGDASGGGIDAAGTSSGLPPAPAWNEAGNDENAAPSTAARSTAEFSRGERSALQQARDARRKQARAQLATTADDFAGDDAKASGSVRRVDSLLGRGGNRTQDDKTRSSSRRRRPRIDGSSSEYGTSDGDMAPGGPRETNPPGRGGLTRGAVAEILSRPSPNERPPRTTPTAPDLPDARANTPRSPPLSPFRSRSVAAGSNPSSPQTTLQTTDGNKRESPGRYPRSSAPPAPLLVPGPDASGRLWANADAADRGETQLSEARFELERLRRLLDASKRERDLLERRFDVELDAREARFTASTRAAADDARARIAARELQLAAERNADQRAYLHELRLVAEEVAAARFADDVSVNVNDADPRDDPREDAEARVRARLDAVRGREVRALEQRVQSLETERARLAEALRAATEAAVVDDDRASGSLSGVSDRDAGLDDVAEKSPAAASAIRGLRAKNAELAQRVRVLEATLEGERAGREREREEFKSRASLGTRAPNSSFPNLGLESDRQPPSGSSSKPPPFASPRAVAAPSPTKAPKRTGSSLDGANRFEFSDSAANVESDAASGDTYRRILAEQRGERKVVRLEAELAKLRAHNEALRRQMRAVQEASFEDVAVIPPSDPAEADAMRRAEEEAHRLGADGAAADAAAFLKAIDALRVATSAASRSNPNDDGGGDGGTDIVAGALAAAADAEAAAWRRAAAAAVQQRKIARLRGETRAWRAALEDERAASRDAGRAWRKIKSDLETSRDEAIESYRRERATGGVRASLAEEAAELAREEAKAARRDAADAFAARDAATGASAGALREARDEAAKLRLRESHWVGLIGCHRESSRVSRELAELATLHGGEAARLAVDAAAGPGAELARRRAAAEAEAESHVEAIKAIADMIEVREAARGVSNAIEFGRAVDRAEAAEASLNATRDRLHAKSEEAAALALKAKRHELRAAEESAERERAQRRAESVAAELARLSDETSLNQRRASEEMARAREELARLREALDDRDAALGAGAELVERDPELARSVSEGKAALDAVAALTAEAVDGIAASAMKARAAAASRASTATREGTPTPGRRGFFGFGGSRESSPAVRAQKEGEGEVTPSPGKTDPASVTRGTIASPGAVAAAVAAATQALVSPKGESPANLATLDTSPIIPSGAYGGSSVGGGGEGGESPYDFLIAGGSAPRPTNPLDDLAAAASAFKRGGVDESFGSSAGATQSTSKRLPRGTTADGDDDDTTHKMSGGSPVQWLGSLLSPSAARRAAAIPLSEANTDADDTDAEEGEPPNDEPASEKSPGLFARFLRRSPSPGKTRMDVSPGALENPRVSRIRAESGDEGGGMSRGTSSENLSVMTEADSPPPSESAASSLPGADEFLHKADKRLEIKVEKSWFGLGSSPSPVRIKVRTGGTSDESSDDANDLDESPTSKMTSKMTPQAGRTPGGSASKKWPSPASVVKSASRAENRAAAEFIAAAEEVKRRSASTTPGKGGMGGSSSGVQSPAQRREERKRRAEAEAAQRRSPYSDATGGSLTTGGGLPTGSDFFNQATQEKSWMQGLGGSPSPSSKRRDAP